MGMQLEEHQIILEFMELLQHQILVFIPLILETLIGLGGFQVLL